MQLNLAGIQPLSTHILAISTFYEILEVDYLLQVIMCVSTAFSNCTQLMIEERVYPMSTDYKQMLKLIDLKNENGFNGDEAK